MTIDQIKVNAPTAWRAYELTKAGNDRRATGVIMGISRHTVSTHINKVIKWLSEEERIGGIGRYADLLNAETVPRCACGLSLPCDGCGPTIWQLATSRSGSSCGEY